jgi:hypothetical protein
VGASALQSSAAHARATILESCRPARRPVIVGLKIIAMGYCKAEATRPVLDGLGSATSLQWT